MGIFKPCGLNPLTDDQTVNLTYDEILRMGDDEFFAYIGYMRSMFRKVWDEQNIAPAIGWSEDDVAEEFDQLAGFPVAQFWKKDELTGRRIIHNTFNVGNSVNSWNLSEMLKVRINYTEDTSKGRSIYDFFARDDYFKRYFPYARRHFLRDSFYFFAQTVKAGDRLPHRPEIQAVNADDFVRDFAKHERPYGTHELLIEAKPVKKGYSGYAEHLRDAEFMALTYSELVDLVKEGVLPRICVRIIRANKELNRDHLFHVRMYEKGQRVFPGLYRSFRISMCQYAVNFPPLTAKLVYETFLRPEHGPYVRVWDPSSGWAGRILGAMASDLRTSKGDFQRMHYIGTDPNPEFYDGSDSMYASVADFYNKIRVSESLFGESHTYEMFCSGSEMIRHNPTFQQYKEKLDLVFSSPPYFLREMYSEDENQSCVKFGSSYESWKEGFLRETLKTAYEWLKPNRYLVWNIADIKVGKKYIPLEQDSIDICTSLGFKHVETTGMTLKGMPGANRVDANGNLTAKNMVKIDGKLYKYEPFFVFRKP